MDTTSRDTAYRSQDLVNSLAGILAAHRSVGGDFPEARQPLIDNLRALQAALPAAISEVEAALEAADA